MSATKFFRNFLSLPQMGPIKNICHPLREEEHCNDDPKIGKTQGSAFPVQESNCKSETHETLGIANGFHQHQEKVSQVASATDLCQNLNDDNRGMQDLSLNPLGLVGTITTKNIENSFCGTKEEGRVNANTATRAKDNEPKAEYKYRSSADIEQQTTTDVDPIGFYISGETTACGILNGCKTEVESEEVTASTGVFDEPFHNYVNTLNAATKMTDLEGRSAYLNAEQQEHLDDPQVDVDRDDVKPLAGLKSDEITFTPIRVGHDPVTISGDECISVTYSRNTDIFEESDCHDIEEQTHKDVCHEAVVGAGVNNLVTSSDIRFQFPSEIKLNENDDRQGKTNQELFLSVKISTAPLDQLSDNSGLSETDNLAFQLGDLTVQKALNFTKESSVLTATNSDSNRSSSKSEIQRSLDNGQKGKVAIVSESSISRTMNRTSDQNEDRDYSSDTKRINGISVGDGIINEDDVSSPETSKCSTMTQTLPASNHSEEAKEVKLSSSSSHAISSPGRASSLLSNANSLIFSKLPPAAALVSDRMVFEVKYMKNPFSCEFCGKRFGQQYHLTQHLMTHSGHLWEKPFFCSQCGMRFKLNSDLCHHKLTHSEERPLPCNICNKSLKTKDDFASHSKVHKEEELRKVLNCNICKTVFSHTSTLKHHMIVHSDSHRVTSFNRGQKEHLNYIPLVNVPFPGATEKLISFRDSAAVEQTQNFKCVQRLSTVLGKADSPDRSEGVNLIMGNGCDIQKQTANCGSNDLKPVIINDEGSTSETTAGENVNPSTFNVERCDVEFSTGSPNEKTNNALRSSKSEGAEDSDDECSSIYKEADCQDNAIREEETQDVVFKTGINDLPATFDVQLQVPSQLKLNKNNTEGRIAHELVLSSKNCSAPGALLNSKHVQINTQSFSLKHNLFLSEPSHSTARNRSTADIPSSVKCLERRLENAFQRSSNSRLNNKTAPGSNAPIVRESCILNTRKIKSKHLVAKDNSSASVNRKRISVGAGIVCEDDASSPEVSQSPAKKQKLFSTDNTEVARDVSSSSTRHSVSSVSTSSSFRHHAHPKVFSERPSTALVGKQGNFCRQIIPLQQTDNSDHAKGNIHPFHLKDRQIRLIPGLPTAPGGIGASDPTYELIRQHVGVLKMPSENVQHKLVTKSMLTKVLNGKRSSLADGILHQENVLQGEGSQSSTTTQQLLSSFNSEAEEYPAQSSSQANNNHCKSFSGLSYAKNVVSSKLPAGSTLVNDRGVCRINDKEKPFACAYCGKAFKIRRNVFSHIAYHHEEKCYSCEICGRGYSQHCLLLEHMKLHTREKPYSCGKCGRSFRWRAGLRRHQTTHSDERPYPCNECNKTYKTSRDLSRHKEYHNKDERGQGVICNICKSIYVNRYALKQHMMSHTGEKPFKCTLCDKQYSQKATLRCHVKTHSGKKRHENKLCPVCGKSIAAGYMPIHLRMHSGEKPFECSICFKRFPKKTNLEGHIRSHTGEKPFACSGCDKRFALYSNMVTHQTKWCLRT